MATLLTIVGDAIKEVGSMIAPSAVYTSTDTNVAKFLALSNREGRDLTRAYNWTVLQRLATITTVASQDEYALPSDYDRLMPDTEWDRSNYQPIWGPLSPEEWQAIKSGTLGSGLVGRRYRIVRSTASAASRTVRIDPTPSTSGDTLVFEYISNAWCTDTLGTTLRSEWAADTDVSLLDRDLMTLGLIVRFKRSVGLEYASEADEYAEILARTKSQDRPAATLSLVGSTAAQFIGPWSLSGVIGSGDYCTEARAVMASFTSQPTTDRARLIDGLIRTLKTSGAWDVIDLFYVLAAADSQAARINWKNPGLLTLATTASPVFVADRGYTSADGGATSWLHTTGISLSSYTLNSSHIGVGINTNLIDDIHADVILYDTGLSVNTYIYSRTADGRVYCAIGQLGDFSGDDRGTSIGRFIANRSAAGATQLYVNGSSYATATNASVAIPDEEFYCAQSAKRNWWASLGGSLTATQVTAFDAALAVYGTAVGAI